MEKIKTKYDIEIGSDVSKKTIDVSSQEGKTSSYPNTIRGISTMLKKHGSSKLTVRVTCESTGTYSELLIKQCLLKEIPVSQINPLWIKSYINSFGSSAKTDPIDANYIRQYAADRNPVTLDFTWLKQNVLKQYKRKLSAIIKERAILKISLDKYDEPFILKDIKKQITNLSKRVDKFEDKIETLIAFDPDLSAKKEFLERTVGVGPRTSQALIIHLPELGEVSRRKIAALAGVAPYVNDSGTKKGKRSIRAGRGEVRSALYMAAISAIKYNPHLKAFYTQLKERGKASRLAIIAVCRKLLIFLNSELKNSFSDGKIKSSSIPQE